jgi:hypothetical protein
MMYQVMSIEEQNELQKEYLLAVGIGNIESVIKLISRGVLIEAQDHENQSTALHIAVEHGHYDIAKYLCNRYNFNVEVPGYKISMDILRYIMLLVVVKILLDVNQD